MNNWPEFNTRYAEEVISGSPGYWESAVIAYIVLVICSIGLGFLIQGRGRSQSLLLVTSRPHTLSQPREYLPPPLFFPLSLLHTSVMSGMVLSLLIEKGAGGDMTSFWVHVGVYSGVFAAIVVICTVMYSWLTRTFGQKDQRELWLPNHFLLLFIFGHSLYIPLTCLLFSPIDSKVAMGLTLALFLLFRGWSTSRLLAIFNQLYHYPLHIILYLCACEIGPLLFILNGSILSK